ncbi:hypothetical protein IFR05_009364 [Cadophora sp. M221]|nr:hypothetical protein IFR05_009364 [Cadophora sp. M221]
MPARELIQREKSEESLRVGSSITADARTNYKNALHTMSIAFSGVQGMRESIFALEDVEGGGCQIIVVMCRLLLDIANHTVVLDCAVIKLPLADAVLSETCIYGIKRFHLSAIYVNKDDMKLWRGVLPALVERCRDWKHLPNCEYKAASKVPLSTGNGAQVICSCGNGKFPDEFITGFPNWAIASKFATRAAISPAFLVSYLEEPVDLTNFANNLMNFCKTCSK